MQTVEQMQVALREMQQESNRRLEELRSAPTQGVSEAMAALSEASGALKSQVSETASLHASVHASMSARSEEALKVSEAFNSQLEQELLRSREMVEKVHKSLADMTSKLVDAVENAA